MTHGEGERLHAARRRRFWLLIGALGLIGFLGGIVSGFVMAHEEAGPGGSPTALSLAAAAVVLVALLAAIGSWRFFVSVDEVEVADNLWGSLIGFYAYALLLPSWWALHQLERAPEPDHWAIYAISMLVALGAYAFRKWQSR